MYRSRMGGGRPDPRVLGYLSSAGMGADSEIASYDILGSQAHVLMLLEAGIIPRDDARRILGALQGLLRKGRRLAAGGSSGRENDAEDIHELVESLVIKKAGPESGGRMHAARSRNDQVALDIRMKVRDDINAMRGHILDAVESMVLLASNHRRTAMPLYTHMQQAQPGLLSHWLLAHADALLRDYGRLSDAYKRVNRSPLGAGPVGGTSLPIDRGYTARLLGFDGILENSLDATSTRDFAAEYAAAVSIMTSNISRMAEDLIVWSTSEFSFVEISDEIASPSSAMPQKKNPDILEITRAKASESAGSMHAILGIMTGLASGYGRDLQQAKPAMWSASDAGISALLAIQSVLGGIRVDKRRMRRAADSGDLLALDLAEALVSKHGVPFRTAHGAAAAIIQHAHATKTPVRRLSIKDIRKALGPGSPLKGIAGDIHRMTSSLGAVESLRRRVSKGSSGYAEQKRMISGRRRLLVRLRGDLDAQSRQISDALALLKKEISRV